MNDNHDTIDALDVLLRGQAVRQFQVQMMLQNPAIAGMQSQKLRIQLGLENLPQKECEYFIKTEAMYIKGIHGTR